MTVAAGTQLGRYEISSLLGTGGMGEVYLAQDTQLRRPVAVKVLPSECTHNVDNLDRFEQEAYAASALNHPNILTIYEIGQTGGIRFIAEEYVEGATLRERITTAKIELSEVLDIAVQVAAALSAAHQAGIVHRDIKPENIIVRKDGYVKVLDFGLAKLVEDQADISDPEAQTIRLVKTQPGVVVGTVGYMSPEQVRGQRIDGRTDVWSLGVLVYEMITGTRPFDGLTRSDIIAAILRTEPLPLYHFVPNTPPELQRLIKKTLRKDRNERCQTIQDLALDLKELRRELEQEQRSGPFSQNVHSVAILPFRNLTNDTAVSFYEFSLADAVITELVRLRSLVVRPSSAVAKYLGHAKDPRDAGRELKVDAVLAANFLHTPGRMRVTAQLLDVTNGEILWGDRIDSRASDIIAVQDMIAQHIVDGLNLQLGSDEQVDLAGHSTANAVAYEEYLRGRDRVGRFIYHTVANEDIKAAIEHFQHAIELDPKFALAHCALGSCYMQHVLKGFGKFEDVSRAQEAFDKGLALDPQIVDARVYMVLIYLYRGEKQNARIQLARLRREAPNNPTVHFISGVLYRLDGDYDKALRSFDRLLVLNPGERLVVGWNRARILLYQGRYDEALRELDQVTAIEPSHLLLKLYQAEVLFFRGDLETAVDLLQEVLLDHPEIDGIRPLLAQCLSAMGKHDAAQAQLTERVKEIASIDYDIPYWLASAYAAEGQREEALKWLEKAISLGNENLPWFESNPVWKPFHEDSRFRALMRRVADEREQRNIVDEGAGPQ